MTHIYVSTMTTAGPGCNHFSGPRIAGRGAADLVGLIRGNIKVSVAPIEIHGFRVSGAPGRILAKEGLTGTITG